MLVEGALDYICQLGEQQIPTERLTPEQNHAAVLRMTVDDLISITSDKPVQEVSL